MLNFSDDGQKPGFNFVVHWQTGNEFATFGNVTTLKLRWHFLEMTSNKEPEKAKFHGQNPLYVKFGNKGWGGGGGGGII